MNAQCLPDYHKRASWDEDENWDKFFMKKGVVRDGTKQHWNMEAFYENRKIFFSF